jgi:uncharacterized membrane protein YqjE
MEKRMNHAVPHPNPKHRAAPVRGLIAAALDYWRARARLFGAEAREAGGRAGVIGALAGGLLFVAVMGYLLLVLATVFGIAALAGGGYAWMWATLGAALLHFGIGVLLFVTLRKKAKGPFFPQSLEELKKDRQWLKQNPKS